MNNIISEKTIRKPGYRWVVYSIAMGAFTVAVSMNSIGVIIPDLMRDLSIDAYQIGVPMENTIHIILHIHLRNLIDLMNIL